MLASFFTLLSIVKFTVGLYTAQPTWITSSYVRAGNRNVISTLTGNNVTPTFNFIFSAPLSGVPYLGYGIKAYEGNDYLGQQYFQVYRTNLDASSFTVAVQILGVTNIFTLNVPYIAIDPLFPHHLNSFDNVPVNYSNGLLTNITSASTSPQLYTNVINYTEQTAGMRYRTFLQPLSRNKVLLFLTSLFFTGSNQGTSTTLRPINITVTTQVISSSQYKISVSLTISVAITKIHFSIVAFDETDVLSTGQYMLVYQKISLPYTGGFVTVPEQFIDNFIMGMLSFSTNRTQVIIDFQWDFRTINGVHGVFMPQSVGVASNPSGGTQTINIVVYTLFYMKTWLCPDETFFDPDQDLCTSCPVFQCLDCQSLRVCTTCDVANNFILNSNGVCQINCSHYNHTISIVSGTDDQCTCQSKFLWDTLTTKCIIQCNTLDHNSGIVPGDDDSCTCDTKFLWNQSALDCYVQCNQLRNAISISPTMNYQCICQEGYGWDTTTNQCVFLCNNIQFTAGLREGTENQCNCINTFVWDYTQLKCVVDCGAINNALSLVEGTIGTCICKNKFIWTIQKKCNIQCNLINNTRGAVLGTTDQCYCSSGFIWNDTFKECIIDCSEIEFSVGLQEGSYVSCQCKKNYRWRGQLKRCILSCEDIQYTQQAWNLPDDIICPCMPEFVWNMRLKQCQYNCSNVQNSTGEILEGTTDSCVCLQEHIWDYVQMSCKGKQFDYLLSTIVGCGVISVAALANFVFIAIKKKIASLSILSNSSSNAIIIG